MLNLATTDLNTLRDAIEAGIDPDIWTAHMCANPQGSVWRDSTGRILHECGKCGSGRELDRCVNCSQEM